MSKKLKAEYPKWVKSKDRSQRQIARNAREEADLRVKFGLDEPEIVNPVYTTSGVKEAPPVDPPKAKAPKAKA